MTETERIYDQIKRAYSGEGWHGPSLREVLNGVSAAQAAARPIPNGHSIWEIVNHVSAWTEVVRQRMQGKPTGQPDEGDFPETSDTSEAAWKKTLAALGTNHEALLSDVAALEESRLEEPCGGRSISYYIHLHGTVHHYLYHAGQIAMLKKL